MKLKRAAKRTGVALAVVLLATAAGPLSGQEKIYDLSVRPLLKSLPGGAQVQLWGYAVDSFDMGDGIELEGNHTPSVPGPLLTVAPGQGLIVNLTNLLPALPDGSPAPAVSILIPGQALPLQAGALPPAVERNTDGRVRSFVHETAPGATVQYVWPSIAPGTYLYHSGTHPAIQVQMGLYGALTRNAVEADPTVPSKAQAYAGAAFEYDKELLFLYSELDPVLHEAVANGTYGDATLGPDGKPLYPQSALNYFPKYFLVNGEVLDDTSTSPANVTTVGSATLLRFLNASLWDHVPQLLGAHVKVIAEDGKPYPYSKQQHSLLLPAGKTLDAVLSPSSVGQINIFDRRLFRSQLPDVQGSLHSRIVVNP